jgi:hypothetical protein
VSGSGTSPGAAPGSFAEESARLLGAFRDWAARGQAAAGEQTGSTAHGPECTYCPICQGIGLLRGARPEVVEHLADALGSLSAALGSLLATDGPGEPRRREEPVQHIDVTGDDAAATGA